MQEIQQALAGLRLGAPQAFRNLAVFPLAAPGDAPAGYLLLDEALERRCARVTEVSREGRVPELAFENDSAESGKEQGRWSWRSRDFASAERALFASARAKKMGRVSASLRDSGARSSDQGEIWEDVAAKLRSFGTASASSSMGDAYESMARSLGEYVAAFRAEPRQCGAVLAIDGKVAGLELFDSAAAFRRYFGKLMRGYAMDALETANGKTLAPPEAEVRRFLERVAAAAAERFAALGEGEDIRLSGEGLAGGALAAGGRVVHLAAHGVG